MSTLSNEDIERAGKAMAKYVALFSRHKALEEAHKNTLGIQSTGRSAADTVYEKAVQKLDMAHSRGMKEAAAARTKLYSEEEANVQGAKEAYEVARTETEAWQAEVKDQEGILVGIPEVAPAGGGRTNLGSGL